MSPPSPCRNDADVGTGAPKEGGLPGNVHLSELGARGGDLLNPKLAKLSLQLTKLLRELVLVLPPQLAGLDLS